MFPEAMMTEEQIKEVNFNNVIVKLLQEGEMFSRVPTGMMGMLQSKKQGFFKLTDCKTQFCFASLEQKNGKAADEEFFPISDIKSFGAKGTQGIVVRNKADETLIELEQATGANAKKEARLDHLEKRKKEAEAKKAKLG